jgi:hypothetical protein
MVFGMSTIRKYIMKHFVNVELHGKRYVLYDNVNHNIVITRYIDEIGLKVLNLMLMQYDGYIIVDDKDYGIETNLPCISSVFKSGPLDGDDVYYKESNSCILIKFSAGVELFGGSGIISSYSIPSVFTRGFDEFLFVEYSRDGLNFDNILSLCEWSDDILLL